MENKLTLWDLEEDLLAMLDTAELVPEEQRAEFERVFHEQFRQTVAKRERVAQFIRHCELQADNCDAEITRLLDRKRAMENAAARVKQYVVAVMQGMQVKKLEGNTATFSLRESPASVIITDASLLPPECVITKIETQPDKRLIKALINKGQEIPGADLKFGGVTLQIK